MKTYFELIRDYQLPIITASDERLKEEEYRLEVIRQLNNLDVSRRELPDAVTIAIANCTHPILEPVFYQVPDFDALFGNDPDFRGISNILKGATPRNLERLRILDLFLRITNHRHTLG